jgi:hypothetical protein
MKMRYYASNKIFSWLRSYLKLDKPAALPWGEWEVWESQVRQSRPVAFWLTETLPDWLEKPAEWVVDPVDRVRCYIRNRWVTRTHCLVSNLKPGQWHELDTRILHSLFNELVNFVEIEKAHMQVIFYNDPESRKKYQMPWWNQMRWLRMRQWRCAQAGLDHLKWESQLVYDADCGVDPTYPKFGKPTPQAVAAQQTLDLYNWWTVRRPARPDPFDASGWTAFREEQNIDAKTIFSGGKITNRERRLLRRATQIENKYDREDQQMLVKLVKISKSLWT